MFLRHHYTVSIIFFNRIAEFSLFLLLFSVGHTKLNYMQRLLILYLFVLSLLCTGSSAAADGQTRYSLQGFPGGAGADYSIYIENLVTHHTLVDVGTDHVLLPASTLKAVTAASVLSLLPHDQCFATRVAIDGVVIGGILDGNIIVRVVGDPTLESSHFPSHSGVADSIANSLKCLGIDSVSGCVRIDTGDVPYSAVPMGWTDDDLIWPYGAPFSAANWRNNRFVMTLPSLMSAPYVPGLQARMVPAKGSIKTKRNRETGEFTFTGTIKRPRRKKTPTIQEVALACHNPEGMMQAELTEQLRSNGIGIGVSSVIATAAPQVIYTHVSPTFLEIMRSMMFRSDNLMAEAMLRTLAPGRSRTAAIDVELKLWKLRGADTTDIVIEDGSGLSRNNRVTAYFMADVLGWMAESPKGALFASLFPRVGVEGTVRNFMRDTPLQGRLVLKTGTLSGVRALAGYMLDNEGLPEYIVVMMVNNYTCPVGTLNKWLSQVLLDTFGPVTDSQTAQ